MKKILLSVVMLFLVVFAGAYRATAAEIAVVDTEKILATSAAGRAGQAHLEKVKNVLQKGYSDLAAMYKGKENTPEAQSAIYQGQAALQQQMNIEQNAIMAVLQNEIGAAVSSWLKKNPAIGVVISKPLLLGYNAKLDVTAAILTEMGQKTPKFADLPTVTLNPPKTTKPAK